MAERREPSPRRLAAPIGLTACAILGAALLLAPLRAADRPVAEPVPASSTDSAAARRAQALAVAESYANLRWTASPRNVLHGEDPDGVRVDTPDAGHRADGFHADGRENVGVPYSWGGFSTPEEFLRGLAEGKLAGHLPEVESAPGSEHTVGVDCSGFVSRCWGLPTKQTTRTLGTISIPLDGYGDLLPGDLLNSGDGHAVLFLGYADEGRTRVRIVEAGFPTVAVAEVEVAALVRDRLAPYRYGPLDPGWEPLPLAAAPMRTVGEFRPTGEAERIEVGDLAPVGLGAAGRGIFARYIASGRPDEPSLALTVAVAGVSGERIELRSALAPLAGENPTDGALEVARSVGERRPYLDALEDLVIGEQRPTGVATTSLERTRGSVEIDGEANLAERIVAVRTGDYIVRKVRYEATLRIEAVRCEAMPLHGVVALREVLELRLEGKLVGRLERDLHWTGGRSEGMRVRHF